MTKEKFIEIFDTQEYETGYFEDGIYTVKDNCFEGLKIIKKYLPNDRVISGANHDIIYSADIDDLIGANITEEDVILLRKNGFMVEDESYLSHFV